MQSNTVRATASIIALIACLGFGWWGFAHWGGAVLGFVIWLVIIGWASYNSDVEAIARDARSREGGR